LKWGGQAPDFQVMPRTVKEIQKIVRLANRNSFILTPRSSATDFSSISFPAENWVLVDLTRMDSILKVDERNRAIMIEPGARWGPVREELKKRGLRPLYPLAPNKDKSVLTSFLEREPRLIPKFEYAESILTMEVVLPNGDVFRTGSASGPAVNSKRSKIDKVGPHGPSVIEYVRLFQGSQGALGIATWINVKVENLPSLQKLFFIPCKSAEDAVNCMYKIQRRQIGYECLALNSRQLANVHGGNLVDVLAPWTVIICLGGGRRRPQEKLDYEEEALHDVVGDLGLEALTELDGLDSSFADRIQGPWDGNTWYKHALKGDSADVFFITTLNRVPTMEEVFSGLAAEHDVDPDEIGTYIQPLEYGRACHVEFVIPFDPEVESEAIKVWPLARESAGVILHHGGFFSRSHELWAETVRDRSRSYVSALGKLKKIFDPNGVMYSEGI
jgi:FAD/FMN-containing dehydrogenase